LAAAFELEKARSAGEAVEYTLFEAGSRLGGALASEMGGRNGTGKGAGQLFIGEAGGKELCRELGLGADLIPSNDEARKTFILVKNRMVPLPDGLMFLVPTKLIPTALTRCSV